MEISSSWSDSPDAIEDSPEELVLLSLDVDLRGEGDLSRDEERPRDLLLLLPDDPDLAGDVSGDSAP